MGYWAPLQAKNTTGQSASPVASGAVATAVHVGSLIVIAVFWTGTGSVTAGTDGLGNTIANGGIQLVSPAVSNPTGNSTLAIYAVINNQFAGKPNYSFTISGTVANGGCLIEEYYCHSGAGVSVRAGSGSASSGATGTTGTPTSNAVVAATGDLIFAAGFDLGQITSEAGTGYTPSGPTRHSGGPRTPSTRRRARKRRPSIRTGNGKNWNCAAVVFAPAPPPQPLEAPAGAGPAGNQAGIPARAAGGSAQCDPAAYVLQRHKQHRTKPRRIDPGRLGNADHHQRGSVSPRRIALRARRRPRPSGPQRRRDSVD